MFLFFFFFFYDELRYIFFFFFSSRRRHTRWTGDWSSDVCSSDLTGVGGAGPGDPDVLEDVLQVGVGQVHVVFRHPVADPPQVAADVGQGRAMAEQAGGQGVPGLVGDVVAEVHAVDPGPEPAVEPLMSQRNGSVLAAVDRGEQGKAGALLPGRAVAVAGGEAVQGLALPFGEQVIEAFGDADRGVVVADLGLVVPEHRHAAADGRPVNTSPGTSGQRAAVSSIARPSRPSSSCQSSPPTRPGIGTDPHSVTRPDPMPLSLS